MFQNLLQNTLSVVANVIFRAPLHTRIAAAMFSAAALAPASYANLLTSTLTPSAPSAPVGQQLYDGPRARPASMDQHVMVSRVLVAPSAPLAQTEWPNPQVARRVAQDTQLGIGLLPPSAGGDAPFVQRDWANPVTKLRAALQPILFRSDVVEVAPDTIPFNEYRWPNPEGVRRGNQSHQLSVSLLTLLPPAVSTPPFVQSEWVNPQRRAFSLDALATVSRVLSNDGAALPFNQYQWPNPTLKTARNNASTMFRSAIGSDAPPDPGTGYNDYHRRYRRISYR